MSIPVGNEPVRVELGDGRVVWVKVASRNVRRWAMTLVGLNANNLGSLKEYQSLLVRWGVQRVESIVCKDDDGKVVPFKRVESPKGKVCCEALSNVLSDEDEGKILAVVAPNEYGDDAADAEGSGVSDLDEAARGKSSPPPAGSTE
jgi:hypothetical protein